MSINRYSPTINSKPYKPYAFCQKSESGNYVLHGDHAAEVARLNEQVRALAVAYERMTSVLLSEGIQVADPTHEAVAAFMRNVVADAVDGFGMYHNFSEKQFIQVEAKKYAYRIRSGELQP